MRRPLGQEVAVVQAVEWNQEQGLVLSHDDLFGVDVLALE